MPSGFDALEGALNISRILGLINRHLKGFPRLKATLKTSEGYVNRIERKTHHLNQLNAFHGLQSEVLFQGIH